MARAHQPAVGYRGPRSTHQPAADGRAARYARHSVPASGIPDGRDHAGVAARLARGGVLRLRNHLRSHPARLQGTAVRVVGSQRSVCARPRRRVGDCSAAAAPRVHLFSDDYDACAIHPGAALSAGLGAGADDQRPTTRRISTVPGRINQIGSISDRATSRRSPTHTPRSAATSASGPIATSS